MKRIVLWLVLIIFNSLGLLLLYTAVNHFRTAGASRNWPTVQGAILSAEVRKEENKHIHRKRGEPITYGFYAVRPCDAYRLPRPYDAGLMLDYGLGGNGRLDPTGNLRDPVVAVNEGDSTLLLGWSYVELAGAQVGTPSFFALRRGAELEHTATPPRS